MVVCQPRYTKVSEVSVVSAMMPQEPKKRSVAYNKSLLRGTVTLSELEIMAVQFHDYGRSWEHFWRGYWKSVCTAARRSRKKFPLGSMIDHLKMLVECGDAQAVRFALADRIPLDPRTATAASKSNPQPVSATSPCSPSRPKIVAKLAASGCQLVSAAAGDTPQTPKK